MSQWTDKVFAALDAADLTTADDLGDIPQVASVTTPDRVVLLRCIGCGRDVPVSVNALPCACPCGTGGFYIGDPFPREVF